MLSLNNIEFYKIGGILKNITITFDKGLYGIYGDSSVASLLRVICGLYDPTNIDGFVSGDIPTFYLNDLSFVKDLTVIETLLVLNKNKSKNELLLLLDKVRLMDKANIKVSDLNSKEIKRLGIISTIRSSKIIVIEDIYKNIEEYKDIIDNLLIELVSIGYIVIISSKEKIDIEHIVNKLYCIEKGVLNEVLL